MLTDFDKLFLNYHHQLFRYTLKFIEDENEALDLVQDIFVEVWERGHYKNPDKEVKAYLFTAVKNSCLNYIRHQKVIRKFEHHASLQIKEAEASYYLSGEQSYVEKESLQRIDEAIDSLNDIYREVIILSRLEGLKNKDIAKLLDVPVRTVETRIFRALALLKEKIPVRALVLLFIGKRIHPKYF